MFFKKNKISEIFHSEYNLISWSAVIIFFFLSESSALYYIYTSVLWTELFLEGEGESKKQGVPIATAPRKSLAKSPSVALKVF